MNDSVIEQKLFEIFSEFSAEQTNVVINLDTRIDAIKLDSLDVLDLQRRIDNELKVNIPVEKFAKCEDIRAIRDAIKSL